MNGHGHIMKETLVWYETVWALYYNGKYCFPNPCSQKILETNKVKGYLLEQSTKTNKT